MRLKIKLFSALVLFAVYLAPSSIRAETNIWRVPDDFPTIQGAIDSVNVLDGDRIMVRAGNHSGAYISKRVEIWGEGGAIINDGPPHPSGLVHGFRLLAGSDGSTFSHLQFSSVDLAIMNGAAVDDVTVTQCVFLNAIQAISNWGGSRWNITQNDIIDLRTQNGGGIGILVADYTGGDVIDNVVAHNKITGTLHVYSGDGGGYAGTGIVLYADFRWGRTGSANLSWNRVVKNKVALASDNPGVVDAWAFELTDTRGASADPPVVTDNAIGFNDFRGSLNHIALTPSTLEEVNSISRNFGENRGHGLHPSVFGPGGN